MARPRVRDDHKLSRRIIFRVTEEEYKQLNAIAAVCGKATGTVAREKLLTGQFPKPAIPKLDIALFVELKRIGNNVNQLTRKVNIGVLPPDLDSLLSELKQLQAAILKQLLHDRHSKNR